MNKIVSLALITSVTLCAFDAEVKKDKVSLLLNDKEVSYEKGDTFTLKAGDLLCFLSGDGRVVIKGDKYSKQMSKRSKNCKRLPVKNKEDKDYLAMVSSKIVAKFGKAKETAVAGVSTRSTTTVDTIVEPIVLPKNNKYLVIENNKWGPLPVTVEIKDKKGNIITSDNNEDDINTEFIFSRDMLQDGYQVTIVNAFDEALMKSVIQIEEN